MYLSGFEMVKNFINQNLKQAMKITLYITLRVNVDFLNQR